MVGAQHAAPLKRNFDVIEKLGEEVIMSNDPLIKHWLLALSLLMLFLFSSCSVFNPTPAVHTLGEAIQGMYTVYYSISQGEEIGRESTEIGELYIHDGEYVFTPTEGITIPESAIDRLYFVSEPKGNYTLDYTKPSNEDTILEDLDDHEILVTINFQGKSP